ncbi:hypothetical protein OKW49_006463 [Paraburkholderia youngii]
MWSLCHGIYKWYQAIRAIKSEVINSNSAYLI